MGDFADDVESMSGIFEETIYDIEHSYYSLQKEQSRRRGENNEPPSNELWTTRNGEQIKICDMTDKHLNNAINYLKRVLNDIF